MSDLSKVLGDLYSGDNEPSVAPPRNFRAEAPEWANDDRLDEAFADWTPGPSVDAHRSEHETMSVVIDMPAVPAARLDEDLSATLSAALVDAGENDTEFPVAAAPVYSLPLVDEPAADYPAPAYPVEEPASPSVYESIDAPAPAAPARPWSRADDDIFPGRAVKGVKAPKTPKAAKGPKVKAVKVKEAKPAGEPVKIFGLQLRRK